MDLQLLANAADDISAMEMVPEAVGSPEEDYEIDDGDSLDFDSWTSLISEIEKTHSDNIKAISSVYESFLSRFPLCHEYWKKYADHMARVGTIEKAVQIFELAVQSATHSVQLWVNYCSFSMLNFADAHDVRRIFERGLSFVGKDFLCHNLWDLYIRFELSQQQWSFLAHILIRTLKFPTKSLHKYYDNFIEFAAFIEEDMSCSKSPDLEPYPLDLNEELPTFNDEIHNTIKELQDSSSVETRSKALYKFIAIGEGYYRKSCKLHGEIDYFENYMERDFFHAEPLDDEQLENWHNYLDFIEKQKDFDWAVKVYERCLIPCANYPEFWMRYVEFMESKGGRELATFALERATQVFLKNVSEVHIFNARFREKIGDIEGARAAYLLCDTKSDSSFIETAIKEANMEKRTGNLDTALEIYDKALKIAAQKEKMHIIPVLYIHFFRLKYLITGKADAAIDLLIAGIQQVPHSKLLLEELINFAMMHDGSRHLEVVDRVMATAITCKSDRSEKLSSKDREELSNLYLKFVDYCGTTNDIRKAWNRHIKSFPHHLKRTTTPPPKHHPPISLSNRLVSKHPSRVDGNDHFTPKLLESENQPEEKQEVEVISGQNEVETQLKTVSFEKEPDSVPPVSAASPTTRSAKEHESESSSYQPDPQETPSENLETCKTGHVRDVKTQQKNPNPVKENIKTNNQPEPYVDSRARPVQQVVQYPVQTSEPPGPGQNTQEAYNQMLQYQYQQQQWLQMQQQSYPAAPPQLPPQGYNQPPQQYVQQQYQVYQQQEQYQQYWYQMYHQQQEYMQQMQQYQQVSGMSNQIWNGSRVDQQGQGMMPPHTTSTNMGFDPYTQQNSSKVVAQSIGPSEPSNPQKN